MNIRLFLCRSFALIGALLQLVLPRVACGMDFSVTHTNPFTRQQDDVQYLVLQGAIEPGDYDRLIRFSIGNNVNLLAVPFVLNSPGGDVTEALAIGRLIKGLYASVAVGPAYGRCASACFIILASSVNRWADPGLVGIHRPYVAPERIRALSPAAAEKLGTKALLEAEVYLHDLRVPTALVDTMFANASTDIHWLTDDEYEHQLGQRAPWYEEYIIARCGFDKNHEKTALSALSQSNDARSQDWINSVYSCGKKLTRADATIYLNKVLRPYGKQVAEP